MDTFGTCLKSLPERKLKISVLMVLAEEISRCLSIDSVVCLLLDNFLMICTEKKQDEQGKIQNVQYEEKRIFGVLTRFCQLATQTTVT